MKTQDKLEKDYKYIRVSTKEQNIARQQDGLIPVVDEISGSVAFDERPGGIFLMKKTQLGFVGSISVQSRDRLGRNTLDILTTINWFTRQQVNIISQKEGLQTLLPDGTENPTAKLLVGILGTLAEFELARSKERQKEGIAKAKKRGVYKDAARKRSSETTAVFLAKPKNKKCYREILNGTSLRRAAAVSGVSFSTAQKIGRIIKSQE